MAYYFIKVKGEIVANAEKHYAQNWVCCGLGQSIGNNGSYCYDDSTHSVKSNLVLNERKRAVPYAIYYTEKGIVAKPPGEIVAYPGYGAALEYYKTNISKISEQLSINVIEEINQSLYKGLFTDTFSILELFLSDIILCLIYAHEDVFNKALYFFKRKKLKDIQKNVRDIENKMHKYFFDEIVYHRFDSVKELFRSIADVDFPDSKGLKKYLHKRNNIVHRYSLSNIDRMRVTIITREDILSLIAISDALVNKLIDNINIIYVPTK